MRALLPFLFLGSVAWGQAPLIDEDFQSGGCCSRAEYEAGVCAKAWICQGSAAWIPPDVGECDLDLDDDGNIDLNIFDQFTTFDPLHPCTQFPGEGYILITPAITGQSGAVFSREPVLLDAFKLTAEVELRDGSIGRPAEGMTVTIVGSPGPPGLGWGGASLGSAGLGAFPTLITTFDNWSADCGDKNNGNHTVLTWSAEGFTGEDCIVIRPSPPYFGQFTRVDEARWPFNTRLPPISPRNRFLYELYVTHERARGFLSNHESNPPLPRTEIFDLALPTYQPFAGHIGATATTGGAWQHHILHSIRVDPFDGCLSPPARVTRELSPPHSPDEASGDYSPGDEVLVVLTVDSVRPASPECEKPVTLLIEDTLPEGWTADELSDSGFFEPAKRRVSWTLAGTNVAVGKTLSYRATAPSSPRAAANWIGSIVETIPLGVPETIQGESSLFEIGDFDECGGIHAWNILGPFAHPFGEPRSDSQLRLDYLTDGERTELDFRWFPGAQISTSFESDGRVGSVALGLQPDLGASRNPGDVPTVFAWNSGGSEIRLRQDVFQSSPSHSMAYAQTYVINETGFPLGVYIASASDDSVQILLNGEEVWIHTGRRSGSDACTPSDVSPDGLRFARLHSLLPGDNSLVMKVFEGQEDWSFACRFQDSRGEPITQGLRLSKYPTAVCVRPPLKATRKLETSQTTLVQGKPALAWKEGAKCAVSIAIEEVRGRATGCEAPTEVMIQEVLPDGWLPATVSHNGSVEGEVVTWRLSGETLRNGVSLSYETRGGPRPGTVSFQSAITDPGSIGAHAVGGDAMLYNARAFTQDGYLQAWLLLGPYRQPGLLNLGDPAEQRIREDYLKDGRSITELTVRPRAGDVVRTAYGPGAGKALSVALETTTTGINPGGFPTWSDWIDADDLIDFSDYYGKGIDGVLMYAAAYILVERDTFVDVAIASDDSVQILLDGEEIWIHSVQRYLRTLHEAQDLVCGDIHAPACTSFEPNPQGAKTSASVRSLAPLTMGVHFLMLKVFEGKGSHGFRLRFQDPVTGLPITQGLTVCVDPTICASKVPPKQFHRGDADGDGQLHVTDAIRILVSLFLGGLPAIHCLDAADADDNGIVELTDAVRILSFLFLGLEPPASPGPPGEPCGPDSVQENPDLGCEGYAC